MPKFFGGVLRLAQRGPASPGGSPYYVIQTDTAALRDWARGRLWWLALVLIVAQLGWKGWLLSRSMFMGDDYNFVVGAAEQGLSLGYVGQVYNGHFMPVAFAQVWAATVIEPYNWFLAVALTLAVQGAASVLMLALLRELCGARVRVLVALAVYAFTPLAVPALLWWAAALQAVPLQLALAGAAWCWVRWLRGGRWPWLGGLGGFLLLGVGASLSSSSNLVNRSC